jgi:hypothetical protein
MDDVSASRGSGGGTLTVGALIAALSIFDFFIFAIPILVLAALFNPLIVFGIAAVVLFVISIAACNWVDRKWDAWIVGTRFEAKMQKVRSGKRARRPIEWIKRGSDLWFGLAAALLDAIQVTALSRLITGRPTGERRIVVASVAYSLFLAGMYSLFGFALGDIIRAI